MGIVTVGPMNDNVLKAADLRLDELCQSLHASQMPEATTKGTKGALVIILSPAQIPAVKQSRFLAPGSAVLINRKTNKTEKKQAQAVASNSASKDMHGPYRANIMAAITAVCRPNTLLPRM